MSSREREARVSIQSQADQGLQVLEHVGAAKHREIKLQPVTGGLVSITGGIGGVTRIYLLCIINDPEAKNGGSAVKAHQT